MPAFKTTGLVTLNLLIIVLSTGALSWGPTEAAARGSDSVNLLINYGNSTLEWHNDTAVPDNWNFYNVTVFVTDGDLAALFFSAFQSHFVYRINGAGCSDSNPFCEVAWSLWILNGVCWKTSESGPDLIPVSEGKTVAWFLVPVDAFGQSPPTGTHCLNVDIDIKPGSDPNPVNTKSQGLIPVAVLTTPTFDATAIDLTTVKFGRTGGEAAPAHAGYEDVDGDGDVDAILHFTTPDTGIQPGDTDATITGRTMGGRAFSGSDKIRAFFPGDVDGDLDVDILDAAALAQAYGTSPGELQWNPNTDFDQNNLIDILDAAELALHYGEQV